jgi:hypothetical protein
VTDDTGNFHEAFRRNAWLFAVLVLCGFGGLLLASGGETWCRSGEPGFLPCGRDWIAALGTVGVGFAAAVIAYQQSAQMKQQTALAQAEMYHQYALSGALLTNLLVEAEVYTAQAADVVGGIVELERSGKRDTVHGKLIPVLGRCYAKIAEIQTAIKDLQNSKQLDGTTVTDTYEIARTLTNFNQSSTLILAHLAARATSADQATGHRCRMLQDSRQLQEDERNWRRCADEVRAYIALINPRVVRFWRRRAELLAKAGMPDV